MQFLQEEIMEITETTWSAMLGLDIQSKDGIMFPFQDEITLIGMVDISGAWKGQVCLYGTDTLSQAVAAKIFSKPFEKVQAQDQVDAIYELTNIIAGNIKACLPEPSHLSLPTVRVHEEGDEHLKGCNKVSELVFECEHQLLLIRVWKQGSL